MTHLFTTYIDIISDNTIRDLYIKELIPQWVKVNSKYTDNITLVTNIPSSFNKIKNLRVLEITASDAFCNYIYPEQRVFHHQVGCWKYFLNTIPYNEIALYMDPDAFMVDNTLLTISEKVQDHQLSKKRVKYGDSDAGVSLLRHTEKTKNMINSILELFRDHSLDCIIEEYYDRHFNLKPEFYISWKDHTLCLSNHLCGVSNKINTIHGQYNLSQDFLKAEELELVSMINKKNDLWKKYRENRALRR